LMPSAEEAMLTSNHLRIWKGSQLETMSWQGYVDYLLQNANAI